MRMSADDNNQADQQYELADPGMAETDHSVLETPWQQQFIVDPLWYTQPVKDCEGVSDVDVASKQKHQTSCSIEHILELSLKIGWQSNQYEVSEVESRVDKRHH